MGPCKFRLSKRHLGSFGVDPLMVALTNESESKLPQGYNLRMLELSDYHKGVEHEGD